MTAPALAFRVAGIPVPQGSKSGWVLGKRAVIHDDNAKVLKPWRKRVTEAAQDAIGADWQPLVGPLRVGLIFGFARPKSHPKTRRTWPTHNNDTDKLSRAVLDALTVAQAWRDDGQVVALNAAKDWCGSGPARLLTVPGVVIVVHRVTEDPTSGPIPLFTTSTGATA